MKKTKDKLQTLDLHGFKQDEVFSAVDSFIMKNQQQSRVRIIPGKGKGLVKQKVIDYLRQARYPYQMENEGSLLVFMD
ncbi:MAG: Smr/MutS family protein [Bdellovibrionaceae bacterium]|nr:Smr/MutS family protein [Pseudobdellovibrionaceae bacterium]